MGLRRRSELASYTVEKVANDGFDAGAAAGEAEFGQQLVDDFVVGAEVTVRVDPLDELHDLGVVVFRDRIAYRNVRTRSARPSWIRRHRVCHWVLWGFG